MGNTRQQPATQPKRQHHSPSMQHRVQHAAMHAWAASYHMRTLPDNTQTRTHTMLPCTPPQDMPSVVLPEVISSSGPQLLRLFDFMEAIPLRSFPFMEEAVLRHVAQLGGCSSALRPAKPLDTSLQVGGPR